MLPVVAVQISPAAPAPELEERLLTACSTGLRARCVAATSAGPVEPASGGAQQAARAVAFVSWSSADAVQIEVGLAGDERPMWLARELRFNASDPTLERWRSIGFTIALMADDPRSSGAGLGPAEPGAAALAAPAPPAALPSDAPPAAAAPASAAQLALRALGGTGLVDGAPRLGAELRVALPLSGAWCFTGSVDYALASQAALEVRWLDAALGVGLGAEQLWRQLGGRVRVELLAENVRATLEQLETRDRQSAWVPGVRLGSDLFWHVSEPWLISARLDLFWLDGATPIRNAGQRVASSAGGGLLLGLGAGYSF